ncbi:MAG TPA: dihydrofolate reductase family protein [Candidatus Dormibacteraeota bacterium]|nr:dihydrofolate reductase family protein [Candidatus Dormibacteraeota bacterium]
MALAPFEVLYEADLPAYRLPVDLQHVYGRLGFPTPVLYSNFVSSVDGVVTLASTPSAGSVISGKYAADRFLMGLLRACADAVVIGAGTLRATPGHLWTPGHVYPDLATEFTVLRSNLGRTTEPKLVVVTASGEVDASHPALVKGAIVMTTEEGAKAIGSRLPVTCEVVTVGKGETLNISRALDELRGRGLKVVLTEGGPHLMGQLIEKGLLDEAFLTISPVVAGRGTEDRLGMVEGVELLPKRGVWSTLLSARRSGDYLFLRYRTSP